MRENPRPVLLECMTFRMRGHEEASGTKYVPQELFDVWGRKDPIKNYESYLLEEKIIGNRGGKRYRHKIVSVTVVFAASPNTD